MDIVLLYCCYSGHKRRAEGTTYGKSTPPKTGIHHNTCTRTTTTPTCFFASRQVKRRVVKRAFYSSEEDESTEEEVEQRRDVPTNTPEASAALCTLAFCYFFCYFSLVYHVWRGYSDFVGVFSIFGFSFFVFRFFLDFICNYEERAESANHWPARSAVKCGNRSLIYY